LPPGSSRHSQAFCPAKTIGLNLTLYRDHAPCRRNAQSVRVGQPGFARDGPVHGLAHLGSERRRHGSLAAIRFGEPIHLAKLLKPSLPCGDAQAA